VKKQIQLIGTEAETLDSRAMRSFFFFTLGFLLRTIIHSNAESFLQALSLLTVHGDLRAAYYRATLT
jgi:hypothetical protein